MKGKIEDIEKNVKCSKSNFLYLCSIIFDILCLVLAIIALLLTIYQQRPYVDAGNTFGCFDTRKGFFSTTCEEEGSTLQLVKITAERSPTVFGIDFFNANTVLFAFLLLSGGTTLSLLPIHGISNQWKSKRWNYVKLGLGLALLIFIILSIVFVGVIGAANTLITDYSSNQYSNTVVGYWQNQFTGASQTVTLGTIGNPSSLQGIVTEQRTSNSGTQNVTWSWDWTFTFQTPTFGITSSSVTCGNITQTSSGSYQVICQSVLDLTPTVAQFKDALPAIASSFNQNFVFGVVSLVFCFIGIILTSCLLFIERVLDDPDAQFEFDLEEKENRWF